MAAAFNMPAFAQQKISIRISVKNGLTKNAFDDNINTPTFDVCNVEDSTRIKSSNIRFGENLIGNITADKSKYLIHVFVFDVDRDGDVEPSTKYEDEWLTLDVDKVKNSIFEASVILNLRRVKQLDEVTVTPSKVKFYYRGDTLIYNASAFVLAEGSMLDALIEQLPGAKIDKKGVITINGRKIDNLLLNGQDLFNGKRELMLQNIGAYTVKNIKVYDKSGRLSDLFGTKMNDMSYVMDVKLKREYSQGFFANAEAGYGTHDRYLGKLFGMWFSDYVSMTAYAGANNLSDESKPGKDDGAWSRESMGSGIKEKQYGGMTYIARGHASKWELKGNVDIEKKSLTGKSAESVQSYFNSGDTYEYRFVNSKNKSWSINTGHNLFVTFLNRVNLNLAPSFSYVDVDNVSGSISASLSEELKDASQTLIEAIYNDASAYRKSVINRTRTDSKTMGHYVSGTVNAKADIKLNTTGRPLLLTIAGITDIYSQKYDRFSRYVIKQADATTPYFDANRYFREHPHRDEKYGGSVSLQKQVYTNEFNGFMHFDYLFNHTTETRTSDLFQLHMIPGYDDFGKLPSAIEYEPTFSPGDSYASRIESNNHKFYPYARLYGRVFGRHGVNFEAGAPVELCNRRLRYDGRGVNDNLSRNDFLLNAFLSAELSFGSSKDNSKGYRWVHSIKVGGRITEKNVDLLNLVEVQNSTDPLNVYLGNPDLHKSKKATFLTEYNIHKRLSDHTFNFTLDKYYDAIARGYIYNPSNGIRTYRMYNVDGNWKASAHYYFSSPFGPQWAFKVKSKTFGNYSHNVDLAGLSTTDVTADPPKRMVNTLTAGEEFEFSWQTGRHRLGALADVRVNRYTSSDEGFTDFTSWTAQYGASGVLNLPRNWGLSTDLTLYTRRGFTDRQLNTTDLVWNARATKSILNGSVVFVVDAYDLLRQLTNVTYTINAQARTETVSNVIPAYVLFHIQYRWNKQPKR